MLVPFVFMDAVASDLVTEPQLSAMLGNDTSDLPPIPWTPG